MSSFDQSKYQKEVLVPAVEEFIKSGGSSMPDVFERYALPLEASDPAEIEQALKSVVAFWNKTKENSKFGNLLKVLLAEHREMSRELLDQKARAALCEIVKEERKKKQEVRFHELDSVIKLGSSKGYLLPEEKDSLLSQFTALGLTQAEILSRIKVPIEKRVVKPPDQGLDPDTRKKLRSNLAVLKKPNLFAFLDLTAKSSLQDLENRYRELSSEWSRKKNDHNKIAANVLLSTVKDKLLKLGLQSYEQALVWDAIDYQLRAQVGFAATDRRISREEFEALVSCGIKYGISREQAIQAILWLAHEKDAVVEQSQSEQKASISCSVCYTSVPQSNNTCMSCGAELWSICPRCKTKHAVNNAACGKCGLIKADLHRVTLLIRKVQFALDEKNLEEALQLARQAEHIWGRADTVDQVLTKVEGLIKQADAYRKNYDEAIKQRKLHAAGNALALLANVSLQHRGWDGKTPEQLQRELDAQFQKIEKLLQAAHEYERQKKTNEAVRFYEQILSIAIDVNEALQGLKRCPPEPAENVKAKVLDGKILIEWNKSVAVGNLEYVIVRCEDRAPSSASDGTVIGRVSSESFCDESASPGSFVYYGVFTERGGVYSHAAISVGVLAVKEVENFTLEICNKLVRGRWDFADPRGKVCVVCGTNESLRQGKGRSLQLINLHSFEDADLINGETYTYRVFVEYRHPDGKTQETAGRYATATPTAPPPPLERFEITPVDGELQFDWTPLSFGTVSIYKLPHEPEWKCGTQIPVASMMRLGTPLRHTSANRAVDSSVSTSRIYYTPFSIAGGAVVVGQARTFITAQEISDLQVEDFDSYLLLRWKWPPNVQSVWICWRHDDYPEGAQDPKSARQKLTKGEYDLNGAFRLQNPAVRPHKFVVYTVAEIDGETIFGNGLNRDCRAEVRMQQLFNIRYSLKTKGWFRKTIVVSLSCDETALSLPELLVVAKRGRTQPLRSEEGIVLARISNAQPQPQVPFEQEFELPALKRPFFLRLFFASPEAYRGFKLLDPPPSNLKVG